MRPGFTFFHAMVDALDQDRLTLPMLPEVALRVGRMIHDESVTAGRLAAEIARDPALATGMMRIANGAVFFGEAQVRTLQQAITRLGFGMVGMVVSALAAASLYRSPSPTFSARLRQSHANALEVAAWSRTVARRFTALDPDEALLAGLLHEVGILPIVTMATAYPDIEDSAEELDAAIRYLGPRIGRRLLGEWHFPEALMQVPLHCTEFERDHQSAPDLADVVTVSLLQERPHRTTLLADVPRERVCAYARLGMDPGVGIPLDDGVEHEYRHTSTMLGV